MARFLGKNINRNSSTMPRRSKRLLVIFPSLKEVSEDMAKGTHPSPDFAIPMSIRFWFAAKTSLPI